MSKTKECDYIPRCRRIITILVVCIVGIASDTILAALPGAPGDEDYQAELQVGQTFPAFEHYGRFGCQAKTAAACGATIIYATGVGGDCYMGLPAADQWPERCRTAAAYVRQAKSLGIKSVLGYLYATSIVNMRTFDAHWDGAMRAKYRAPPSNWRQQDRNGSPLPSWYGGEYHPACINNPDWREYGRYDPAAIGNRARRHFFRHTDRTSPRLLLPALHGAIRCFSPRAEYRRGRSLPGGTAKRGTCSTGGFSRIPVDNCP